MDDENEVTFTESLDDNDYGLIVDQDGELKGVWVPEGLESEDFPQAIVELCIETFGVDITDQEDSDSIPNPISKTKH